MSRPRDRASTSGLLPLMEARPWKDGKTVTYRYHPIGGKPINLGTDLPKALQKVLNLNGQGDGLAHESWEIMLHFAARICWLAAGCFPPLRGVRRLGF